MRRSNLRRETAAAGAVLLTFAAAGILASLPAHAAPSGTAVTAVYQLPCPGGDCGDNDRLEEGDPGSDSIQIHVRSNATLGLSELRLEARRNSEPWTCLRRWNPGGSSSFTGSTVWDTKAWPAERPDGCADSDRYASLTENGTYTLRLTATERTTGDRQQATFILDVVNRPQAPQWAASPVVRGDRSGSPAVRIHWRANPEPDVVEYRYIRIDPPGGICASGCEYVVSADAPGGQGCSREGDIYTCDDDDFRSTGYGGTYEYRLAAYRASPQGTTSCVLPPRGTCAASPAGAARTAQLQDPPPPPSPASSPTQTSPGSSPGSSPGGGSSPRPRVFSGRLDVDPMIPDTFETSLPYADGGRLVPRFSPPETSGLPEFAAGARPEARDLRSTFLPIAGALLLLLGAAHMARMMTRWKPDAGSGAQAS